MEAFAYMPRGLNKELIKGMSQNIVIIFTFYGGEGLSCVLVASIHSSQFRITMYLNKQYSKDIQSLFLATVRLRATSNAVDRTCWRYTI